MEKKRNNEHTEISNEDINSIIEILKLAADKAKKESDKKTAHLLEIAITVVNLVTGKPLV